MFCFHGWLDFRYIFFYLYPASIYAIKYTIMDFHLFVSSFIIDDEHFTVGSNRYLGSRNEHDEWIHIPLFRYILGQPKSMKKKNFWGENFLATIHMSKIRKSYKNHKGENTKFEFSCLFLPRIFFLGLPKDLSKQSCMCSLVFIPWTLVPIRTIG